jgi:hypothetical protein|tara:strand:- start:164 stop:385 length:222 start_codon:yes stop_codon:yes gene_type:complete
MIYIIWEIGSELVPQLKAFKNKSDAHKYFKELEQYQLEIQQTYQEHHFDFGMWEVPFSTTQTDMAKNITRWCF